MDPVSLNVSSRKTLLIAEPKMTVMNYLTATNSFCSLELLKKATGFNRETLNIKQRSS